MKYQYLLFDLDGTLTDSKPGITKSVQYSLGKMGREIPAADELECYIGPPLSFSFHEYGGMEGEEVNDAIRFFRERYTTVGKFENYPYDGIKELLAKCKEQGMILVTASSKLESLVKEILEHFGLACYFDLMVGSVLEAGGRTTKEEVLEEVLRQLGITDEEGKRKAVMIGDRHFDIDGANYFGLDSIGVEYGYAKEGELREAGATYVVGTVKELEELLLGD